MYNRRAMKRILTLLAFVLPTTLLFADEPLAVSKAQMTDVIDIPTAYAVDHYGYNVSFRFASEGAVQNKTTFGVLPRLNIGFGLDGEHIIGTGDARLNTPTINVKFQIVKPETKFPALALGFDGQGYHYDKDEDEYAQREKGLYLVGTGHIFVPELALHVGGDIFDFDEHNSVRAFSGLTYTYETMFSLLFEYDNIDMYKERRINYGAKLFITPVFTVDLLGRNVPKYVGSESRETERVVRLNYSGSF